MKRFLAVLLWAAAAAASFAVLGGEAATGTIQGAVYRKGTKDGIKEASVVLAQNDGRTVRDLLTVKADDKGRYVIKNVKPGTYQVFAEADGFVAETHLDVKVKAGDKLTHDFYLSPVAD